MCMTDLPTLPVLDCDVAIVGAGPAGLMAAEQLTGQGLQVCVFDGKASAGRKFLLAGKGGMNLTHSEVFDDFAQRYGHAATTLTPMLRTWGAEQLRAWAQGLGIATFVGSSGRVFPSDMKAAPLLRAWLARLRAQGVRLLMRHRWQGWDDQGRLCLQTPQGLQPVQVRATLLALGGGSWPQLGSDGAWQALLQARGVDIAALQPANCGFDVQGRTGTGWSTHFQERFAGAPLKNVAITWTQADGSLWQRQGEFVVTASGVEGSLVYAASAVLRDAIALQGQAQFMLNLLPAWAPDKVLAAVQHPRGARSLSNHLKSRLGLDGVKLALLYELLTKEQMQDSATLAHAIQALPVALSRPRPLAEAISSAGGVRWMALDDGLMLRALPGVFCAGEMIDWEAPTGGYLLTACFATGVRAAQGIAAHLAPRA
ncbi:MAG: TIGR03862 family flavoprotein [Comamonas sp.]|jgi:uncharacterized flavoprotein (TIGR03862 family)|nr:TIGR03862 family flavoprotein [Comamonas sp.]